MCLSRLGQIVYGGLALVAVGLILASMFTPGWRDLQLTLNKTATNFETNKELPSDMNIGLFAFACRFNQPDATIKASNSTADYCKEWFANRPDWEKIVIGAMVCALLVAAFSFVWNLLTFCACCCKGTIFRPLPLLAGATGLLLAGALVLYFLNNQTVADHIHEIKDWKTLAQQNTISYSFYMALGAMLASFANLVVGTLIVCLADKCL